MERSDSPMGARTRLIVGSTHSCGQYNSDLMFCYCVQHSYRVVYNAIEHSLNITRQVTRSTHHI